VLPEFVEPHEAILLASQPLASALQCLQQTLQLAAFVASVSTEHTANTRQIAQTLINCVICLSLQVIKNAGYSLLCGSRDHGAARKSTGILINGLVYLALYLTP
jgi:hypothetical protein